MAIATLQAIQTKVRRLTRSPSDALLTTAQINEYIDTFMLYDFPEHLRLFALRTTLTFFTEPFIDTYETNNVDPTSPLFNFKNRYITTHEPLMIAGYQRQFSQSRAEFYNQYPILNTIASIGTAGDGITTNFTGVLANIPILRNQVLFSSVASDNTGLALSDDGLGNLTGNGSGTIDYITGAFVLNFIAAPGMGIPINSQTVPYVPSLPLVMLFFDEKFTLRPVPDQAYRVNMEVYIRPSQLTDINEAPQLEQWWQYIAYGAAKKVFEDRTDSDSVQQIMPEFNQQQRLVLRTTLVQNAKQRTPTIYTENVAGQYGPGWSYGGGSY